MNPLDKYSTPKVSFLFKRSKHALRMFSVNNAVPSKIKAAGTSRCGAVVNESDKNHAVEGSIPALAQWVNDSALPRAVV